MKTLATTLLFILTLLALPGSARAHSPSQHHCALRHGQQRPLAPLADGDKKDGDKKDDDEEDEEEYRSR